MGHKKLFLISIDKVLKVGKIDRVAKDSLYLPKLPFEMRIYTIFSHFTYTPFCLRSIKKLRF